ncbi:saccharopine dehydrogenase [Falsirhodobacter deserti]|uniref:saccharopine dehydrogenase n=1 Tax=Falsirhodobacter deserti TaxID=1365611 RepID=UPI000FE3760B|nr:saccharopine dehydrogenase [Falsirhodobacter deserti]
MTTHLWMRHEQRPHEERTGLTPEGVAALVAQGFRVTVEDSPTRCIATAVYAEAGAQIAPAESWPVAPRDAIIFGLKELPEDGTPLIHRHILFGHAFKGQRAGQLLLARFRQGGGTLYDLESLVDESGRRVAAFGYWAGYAGAAVALKCWAAQQAGGICGPLARFSGRVALLSDLAHELGDAQRPRVLIIGANGRVGTGADDLCSALEVPVTRWDMAETASGGPFPEVLTHDIFLNCILARPGCPVFVPVSALAAQRALRVIGDIACDPSSDYSPIKVYDRTTDWDSPALRVADAPVLDVTAIDNLPSLLPVESSEDYAIQLLPSLRALDRLDQGVWARAKAEFDRHI